MSSIELNRIHHQPGQTDICYNDDGSCFVTCGQDGDVHWFDCSTDQVEHIRCADQCYSAVIHESNLFVATNRHELEVRSLPTGDNLPSLVHLNQSVCALSRWKKKLIVGTRDFQVLMIDLTDDQRQIEYFDKHQAPILSLNVDNKGNYLVSSSCDGLLRIFSMENKKLIKSLPLINKSNDIETAKSLVKVDWDVVDNYLSVPVKNRVEFYGIGTWNKVKQFENKSTDEFIDIVRYSSCSSIFVVSSRDCSLSVVRRSSLEIIFNYSLSSSICSMVFSPREKFRLSSTTFNGDLFHVDLSQFVSQDSSIKTVQQKTECSRSESELDPNDELSAESDDDGDDDDDDNKGDRDRLKSKEKVSFDVERKEERFELHEVFQSTQTSRYLESRFLIWNEIGAITSYRNQIEISFHDVTFHHSITVDNKIEKYSFGDLSMDAVVLGSSEKNRCLTLLYKSWDSNMKEWSIEFEKNEIIQLVRLTRSHVVAGSSAKNIRLFTLSGIEQRVIRFQSPLISLSSFDNRLLVVHHSSMNLPKEQSLSFSLIDLDRDEFYQSPLPLNSKSKLTWIGFSDSGNAYYAEKCGHLTLLRTTKNKQFEPCLITNLKDEAERNKLNNYWLLGINDFAGRFQVRVIELKNQSYPELVPWPIVKIISPNLSLLVKDSERMSLESDLLKEYLFPCLNDDDQDEFIRLQRETLIKLFALACKTNREYRCLEIAHWMDKTTIQLALKYATKSGKLALAEKISQLSMEKFDFDDDLPVVQGKRDETVEKAVTIDENRRKPMKPMEIDELDSNPVTLNKRPRNEVPFSNPFRKGKLEEREKPNDDFSLWKPKINKVRPNNSTKSAKEENLALASSTVPSPAKRKIEQDQSDENNSTDDQTPSNKKRNKLRQFSCQN